jgi:hypothetical protein
MADVNGLLNHSEDFQLILLLEGNGETTVMLGKVLSNLLDVK